MEHFKFVQNKECEYFPCHKIEEESFNCLFCYCPLYALKDTCNGNPKFLEDGTKSCEDCTIVHMRNKGYDHVMKSIQRVLELGKK